MSWWTEMDWSVTPVSAMLAQVADKRGLSLALSRELAALQKRAGSHDRGRVSRDLAVMLAHGGDCLTDLGAVRDQAVLCHAERLTEAFGGQSAAANVDTLRHMARAASSSSRLTVKGRATRARIIDAAAQLMYEKGAANTSFEDVRKAAKASGSQMSHYFADKRSLIRAVIAHQADAVMADHHDPAIGNLDSIAALRAWAQRIVEQQRAQNFEGGCRLGSLAAELVESDAELQADFAAGFERWEALLRRGLLRMQQRGDLRPDADPDALAYSLLAAAQGGYLLTQAHRDARALQAALGAAIDHIELLAVEASKRSTG